MTGLKPIKCRPEQRILNYMHDNSECLNVIEIVQIKEISFGNWTVNVVEDNEGELCLAHRTYRFGGKYLDMYNILGE